MKNVLVWTNCQGGVIMGMLKKYHSDKYTINYFVNYEYIRENKTLPAEFKDADIFIYQKYYPDKHGKDYDLDYIINNTLKSDCKTICIPFLYFEGMFSYDMAPPINNFKTETSSLPFGKFFYGIDFVDNKLIDIDIKNYNDTEKENLIESIYQDFISDQAISEEKIKYYYDRSFEYLEHKILNSDIPCLFEYIKENFTKTRLWHNRMHPSWILMNELVKGVFKLMQLELIENEEDLIILDSLKDWVMPIPPCVKKYYNMKFDDSCSVQWDKHIVDTRSFISQYINVIHFDIHKIE